MCTHSYGTTKCATACDHPWMDQDLWTSLYLQPLYQFLLDFLKLTAKLFLVLTAVSALRLTKLTRAGAKQLTAVGQLLALLEYHSCEQQAQHVKVVINLPWWLQFVIILLCSCQIYTQACLFSDSTHNKLMSDNHWLRVNAQELRLTKMQPHNILLKNQQCAFRIAF